MNSQSGTKDCIMKESKIIGFKFDEKEDVFLFVCGCTLHHIAIGWTKKISTTKEKRGFHNRMLGIPIYS